MWLVAPTEMSAPTLMRWRVTARTSWANRDLLGNPVGGAPGRDSPAGTFLDRQLIPYLCTEFGCGGVKVLVEGIQQIGQLFRRQGGEDFFRTARIADDVGEVRAFHRVTGLV